MGKWDSYFEDTPEQTTQAKSWDSFFDDKPTAAPVATPQQPAQPNKPSWMERFAKRGFGTYPTTKDVEDLSDVAPAPAAAVLGAAKPIARLTNVKGGPVFSEKAQRVMAEHPIAAGAGSIAGSIMNYTGANM